MDETEQVPRLIGDIYDASLNRKHSKKVQAS
jgi:hypothetical protein